MTAGWLEGEVRARHAGGASPKEIARALGIPPAVVIPIVRQAASEREAAAAQAVYQLKVTLQGARPPVWRRFQVPGQITLARLHLVLQAVMGWENDHLYMFRVGQRRIGEPSDDYGNRTEDASRIELRKVAGQRGARLTYIYDFGDDWHHQLVVEKTACPDVEAGRVACLSGRRACPPEDCGGIWGYSELLTALDKPTEPDLAERIEWLEEVHGAFDPDHFDLAEVTRRLRNLNPPHPSPNDR
jgi:Plasmid pRiA4b ORF-3-like protein